MPIDIMINVKIGLISFGDEAFSVTLFIEITILTILRTTSNNYEKILLDGRIRHRIRS